MLIKLMLFSRLFWDDSWKISSLKQFDTIVGQFLEYLNDRETSKVI